MWKEGEPQPLRTDLVKLTHNRNTAVFRLDYTIGSFGGRDIARYRCYVKNPIGSDSHYLTVVRHPEIRSKQMLSNV